MSKFENRPWLDFPTFHLARAWWGSSLLSWVGAALLRPTQHAASGADDADCLAIIVHYRGCQRRACKGIAERSESGCRRGRGALDALAILILIGVRRFRHRDRDRLAFSMLVRGRTISAATILPFLPEVPLSPPRRTRAGDLPREGFG
jgi:hypothetical protein